MLLLQNDRCLFSQSTWSILPQLLGDLLERQRISLGMIEDVDTGELCFLGGAGFLDPVFLEKAVDQPENLVGLAFAAESRGQTVFLNTKQVAVANRAADIRLLNFLGDASKLELGVDVGITLSAWNFFHRGFHFKEIWTIVADPGRMGMMSGLKAPLREGSLSSRDPYWVFLFSREDALTNPSPWPNSVMLAKRPILGFTRPQQRLLEMALLDYSDRQVEIELRLSPDAVKKRWRAIYEKVGRVEPKLLPPATSGADRRRILLQRLREHLEELRPW